VSANASVYTNEQHITRTIDLSLIGGPLVILTGDSEPEHCHDISIGEAVRIMRISKEGLRQLHKDGNKNLREAEFIESQFSGRHWTRRVHNIHTSHPLHGLGSVERVTGSIMNCDICTGVSVAGLVRQERDKTRLSTSEPSEYLPSSSGLSRCKLVLASHLQIAIPSQR
jgi:hypothetical protein